MTPTSLRRWIYLSMAGAAVVMLIVPSTIFITTQELDRDNLGVVAALLSGVLLCVFSLVKLRTPRIELPDPATGQTGHRVERTGVTGPDGTVRWLPEYRLDRAVALRNAAGELRYLVHYLDDGGSGRAIAISAPDGRPLGSVHNRTDLSHGLLYGIRDGQGRPRAYLEALGADKVRQFAVKVYAEETTLGVAHPVVPFLGQPVGMVALAAGTPEPIAALCALFALEFDHFRLRLR